MKKKKDPPAIQNKFDVPQEDLKYNVTINPALKKSLGQKDVPPAIQNKFDVPKEDLKYNVTINPALENKKA